MEDKMIRKIQSLLERAAHPETPEAERESSYSKANQLANKFRIDVSKLGARQNRTRIPVYREFDISFRHPYAEQRKNMQYRILMHFGVSVIDYGIQLKAVGYEEDFTMSDMMWASVHLDFANKIMPVWNSDQDLAWNVFTQKHAAKSWMEIINMAPKSEGLHKNSGNMLRGVYAKECARRGVEPLDHSRQPKKFREAFANAYEETISMRLYRLAREEKEFQNSADGDKEGMLALVSDADKLKQAFYDKFPHMAPITEEALELVKARIKAREEAEEARRAALTPKERLAEDLKREREEAKRKARWAKEAEKDKPDPHGWQAGKQAATMANLGGNTVGSGSEAKELS